MLIHYDPDEYENVSEYRVCAYHEAHPGKPWAGCSCSASFSSRMRTPEEIAVIKAKKLREHEDRVLAEAEAIKARRGWPVDAKLRKAKA